MSKRRQGKRGRRHHQRYGRWDVGESGPVRSSRWFWSGDLDAWLLVDRAGEGHCGLCRRTLRGGGYQLSIACLHPARVPPVTIVICLTCEDDDDPDAVVRATGRCVPEELARLASGRQVGPEIGS